MNQKKNSNLKISDLQNYLKVSSSVTFSLNQPLFHTWLTFYYHPFFTVIQIDQHFTVSTRTSFVL